MAAEIIYNNNVFANAVDIDTTLSNTSTNPVQNKVVQAPIASLVDRGAKNLFKYSPVGVPEISYVINNDGSVTVTADNTTTVHILVLGFVTNLDDGEKYTLSGITGGSYDNSYGFAIATSTAYGKVFLSDGHVDFVKTSEMYQFELVVRAGQSWTKTFYPMICTKAAWDISHKFVPYCPSMAEMYALLADKADKSTTYTKTEVDTALASKVNKSDVTTTINSSSTDNQVPTARAVYDFTSPIFSPRYGFRIDKNNSDPDTRVEYLYDAVGMTPAKMTYDETTHKGTFNYGSWSNVWFVKNNRPVKLNFNGTVEAELNPNNYWKTIDGQDSGLETATNCNFMSEIPIVYVKRWEDENYNYVVVCDKKYDKDYLAYANTDKDGNIKPLYAPIFKGYKDSDNRLRSIAGVDPLNNRYTYNEVTYANNINTAGSVTGWQIEDLSKHELISDLLTLISKSTDSQTIFGNGVCKTSTRVFTGYNEVVTGTKTTKSDCGQFCGYNDDTHHVNVFHIQDFWGNRWDKCLGLITSGNKYYYKMTPENGGYTYTENISDYTNNGYTIAKDYSSNDITPPANGNIKNQSTGIFGNLPIDTTGASSSTYYCDYYWYNSSGVCLLLLSGAYGYGRDCGARCFDVYNAPSDAVVSVGASPFYV